MPGPNEWEQYYQKTFMDNIGLQQATPNINGAFSSDSTIVATSSAVMTENMKINSPSSSYNTATTPTTTSSGQLTPTGSVSKPIRRRSRVSKKTPITLLNANANNFRALVQQFTGCSTASTPMSFGNQKGPINLSFGLNNNATNAVIAPFGNNYNSNSYHHQQLQQQQQQQQQQQEQKRQPLLQLQENQQLHQEQQQQCMYPFDNISGGYNPMALETVDGLVMDQEDIALNDFSLFTN